MLVKSSFSLQSFIRFLFLFYFFFVSQLYSISLEEKNKRLKLDLIALNSLRDADLQALKELKERFNLLVEYFPQINNSNFSQILKENRHLSNDLMAILRELKKISSHLSFQAAQLKNSDEREFIEKVVTELDSLLKNYTLSSPKVPKLSLRNLKVVSVDRENSLLILNAGRKQGVHIGMTFSLRHSKSPVEVVIVDTSDNLAVGFLLEEMEKDKIKIGEKAVLKTFLRE